jgi:hypothetical protein
MIEHEWEPFLRLLFSDQSTSFSLGFSAFDHRTPRIHHRARNNERGGGCTKQGFRCIIGRQRKPPRVANEKENVCAGANLAFQNKLCLDLEVTSRGQAGANVTEGYVGDLDWRASAENQALLAERHVPPNVHWHLGAEHYSIDQYDETDNGPKSNIPRPAWVDRDLSATNTEDFDYEHQVREGFRCLHRDPTDSTFTTPYNWQHCKDMEVGETI